MSRSASALNRLPHRYPFLMIDDLIEIEAGKWARGRKTVSGNEWYVTDAQPYMPPAMIVEALAQLGAFTVGGEATGLGFLSSIIAADFLGFARPGDRIELHYEVIRHKAGFVLGTGLASVNGETIVRVGEIMTYHAK